MSKASFEKVTGFGLREAFKSANKLRPDDSVACSTSDTAPEHIYIVFSEEITIEDGIETIEGSALAGDVLQVSRFDVIGHAAVAIVSTFQRKKIEELPIVKKVKVIEPDHPNFGKAAAATTDAFL